MHHSSSSYPHHTSSPPHPSLLLNNIHLLQPHDMASFYGSSELYAQTPPASYSSLSSSLLERSNSSISFHHSPTSTCDNFHHHPTFDNRAELFDNHPMPMRRIFSTGDIDPFGGSNSDAGGAAAAASPVAAAIGGTVGRYNAEERRERIERYRSKRNQRNFQKKITYACRKTLADSRPRVRGRFARNGEPEPEMEAGEAAMMAYYANGGCGDVGRGGGCYDWREVGTASMSTVAVVEASAGGGEEEDGYCYDDSELWTTFLDVFSSL